MTAPRWLAPAVTGGVVVVGLAVVFELPALRMVLAVLVCLLLPGWGWARRFRTRDRGDTLALTVVLSICATVVVSTAMVVTARWSTLAGVLVLVAIGAAGLVPESALARLRDAVSLQPAPAGGPLDQGWGAARRHRPGTGATDQPPEETEWVDWYVGARRRAAEERARLRALRREADEQWAEWFRTAHPERAARKR